MAFFCDFRDINRKATHLGSLFLCLEIYGLNAGLNKSGKMCRKPSEIEIKKRGYISVTSSPSVTPTGFKPVTA